MRVPPRGGRPRLLVDGSKVARNAEGWLVAAPRNVFVRDWKEQETFLEVSVEHPGIRESFPVPLRRGRRGYLVAGLSLPERGPFGLARVSVHMRYHRSKPLAGCTFWYWPSLKGLRGCVFDAACLPGNLAELHLDHIKRTDGRISLSADASHMCRLAFEVDGRIISFLLRGGGAIEAG